MPTGVAYPVFGGLPDKGTLTTSRTSVALNWMTSGSYKIVELRKLDDESIPVVTVERSLLQIVLDERRLEVS